MLGDISYPPIPGVDLGPFGLSLHGAFAGLGIAAGILLLLRQVRRDRLAEVDLVISVLAWGVVGALIGIRLFTVPARIGDPGFGWFDVVDPRGRYSMFGGLTGGMLAAAYRLRRLRLPVAALFNAAALPLAVGQAIGRLGDLAIAEHLGSPTSWFFGYSLRPGYDVSDQHDALEAMCNMGSCGPYHHTALYDLLGLALLAVVLWRLSRRLGSAPLILIWATWYGLQRFVIDFARLEAAREGLTADSVIGR